MQFHRYIGLINIFFYLLIGSAIAQDGWRTWKNEAFKPGEKLEYRFYYDAWLTGKITAGIGTLEVKTTDRKFDGRSVWHIDTEGKSKGMFNWFFKVHDQFDSYVDQQSFAPHYFIRRTKEGGFTKDDEYRFNHEMEYVVTLSDSLPIPKYTLDFVSAVYFARTFNSDTLEMGDMLPVHFFLDDSVYNSAILYEGKEVIEIELGVFRCLRFKPGMATGEVFADKYPMTLWVTDDKNHVPILAKSAVIIGNVKAELMSFEGLANPLSSMVRKD
ncbi:MAG: DUF3108 domain-containing protein [Bacteroidales bacterium]|nr:DUF3108 domain-containing protein [Bacteroidales bacterium]